MKNAISPGLTSAPSLINTLIFRSLSITEKISVATLIPASTPFSFIRSFALPVASAGMHAREE